jgi:XTP/dITP diphosphohydrolase
VTSMKNLGQKLVLATHNKGKLAEISDLMAPYGVAVVSAGELNLPEPDETEDTFVGNAFIKARAAAKASGLAALADDSGLCVAALGGQPGVYSANWAGPNKDFGAAMERVHTEMGDAPDKSAYFISVFALVLPDGSEYTFEGRCEGEMVWPPRGSGGFGYDPMFVPGGESRTFGEMDMLEKKKYSHRAMAFAKLLEWLKG